MNILIYAVPILLVGSVLLFAKSVLINQRPQRMGLLLALIGLPLYTLYYGDRPPFESYSLRGLLTPLAALGDGNTHFRSLHVPAVIIASVYVIRVLVFQRVAVRRRLQHVNDPIANFFSGLAAVILLVGIITSTFAWGWVGSAALGSVFAIGYLGAIGTFGALVELTVEMLKFGAVWVKRKVFGFATHLARFISWLASLPQRLVPDLRALVERVRAGTTQQELTFEEEKIAGDQRLADEFERGHDRSN